MKIKRYVVREMQEAIRLIKQDLGPEALIVSSYKVSTKGFLGFFSPRLLEVTAVLDDHPEIKLNINAPQAPPTSSAGNAEKQIDLPKVPARALPAGKPTSRWDKSPYLAGGKQKKGLADEDLMYARQEEMRADQLTKNLLVKDTGNHRGEEKNYLFDAMVRKHVEQGLVGDAVSRWRKMLLDMDVQENIAERLLSFLENEHHLPDTDDQGLYLNLFKQITNLLAPAYCSQKSARVLTFIGPAGVGKTTTLAKLATRFSLNDHKKIALVTVNTYRIGAVEQLRAYGDFLGIPVEVVMTPAELAQVLESHRDKDYIFIDTFGRSARNAGQILELIGFLEAVEEPQDIFLVMSLITKNRDLNRIACEFQKTNYSKLIFTKVDETETHGAILNLICTLGLPVAYLTHGQGIPDDISEAGPKKIAKLLLRGVDPDEVMVI